jgi:hypothetical protein
MSEKIAFKYNYGVIIFVFAGILIVPQLYYLSNIKEFSYDILLPIIPVVVAAVVFFILSILIPVKPRGQLFLAGLGLAVILGDQLLGSDIGHLDGASSEIAGEPVVVFLNAFIYFGLPVILLLYGNKFKKLLIDLSYVVCLLGIGVSIYSFSLTVLYSPENGLDSIEYNTETVGLDNSNKLPNVYFIWMDAMETGYMKKYLSQYKLEGVFSGFTLFENNSSNYLYTSQSYPSFMSGTIFKGGDYDKWSKRGDDLRKKLGGLGYDITSYAKKDFVSSLDDISYTSDKIYSKWTHIEHPFVSDFISYWVVRSLPSVFANQSLSLGKIIGSLISPVVNVDAMYSKVASISDGIEPLSGVFTLKQFNNDEKYRTDKNELVIMQAIIPHGPYVIDANCGYRGPQKKNVSQGYYEQVICSAGLVKDFLENLKKLDRYNSSLIVVMGDHGSGWAGLIDGHKDGEAPMNHRYTPWSKSMLISRSSALLMIKPPRTDADSNLVISKKESQLIDIYPTILSLLGEGIEVDSNLDGNDLFANVTNPREKYITYFKPSKILNLFEAEIYDLEFESHGGLSDIKYRSKFKDKKDLKSIKYGEVLTFSSVREEQTYLSSGLSTVEKFGRWSDSKKSTITFKLDMASCKSKELSMNLRGFVTKSNPEQKAEVLLNNEYIGEVKIKAHEPQPKEFSFGISKKTKCEEVNTLEFKIENPVSPKSLGVNSDTRTLGIGFESMIFQ